MHTNAPLSQRTLALARELVDADTSAHHVAELCEELPHLLVRHAEWQIADVAVWGL